MVESALQKLSSSGAGGLVTVHIGTPGRLSDACLRQVVLDEWFPLTKFADMFLVHPD